MAVLRWKKRRPRTEPHVLAPESHSASHRSVISKKRSRILLAWCVHLYTAMGLLAAAGIAMLIVRGGGGAFRWAFVLMFIATLIDATDGTFARMIRIKEVLPGFDGRRLDDLVDFLNYSFLPLLLLWRAEIPSPAMSWCLLLPLLASGYGFCQVGIKTDDGYFLGFPSCWNVVAFYLYVLRPNAWISLTILLVFAVLTFVPSRYLYPSQKGWINRVTSVLATLWCCSLAVILYQMPDEATAFESWSENRVFITALLSLSFPAYYIFASWGISFRLRRRNSVKLE
jgi:phosphatidylcholine synthase